MSYLHQMEVQEEDVCQLQLSRVKLLHLVTPALFQLCQDLEGIILFYATFNAEYRAVLS